MSIKLINKIKNNIMKKLDKKELKAEIKTLVSKQKLTKLQRKTVNLVGERIISEYTAQIDVCINKRLLSAMYVAYGVLRGKNLEDEIKNHVSQKCENEYFISGIINKANTLIEKYKVKVPETETVN